MLDNTAWVLDHASWRAKMENNKETSIVVLLNVICLTTLIVGMFLPIISSPLREGGLINVIWGSVYGLGFAASEKIFGREYFGVLGLLRAIWSFILWPGFAFFAVKALLSKSIRWKSVGKLWIISIVSLTFLINVPIENIQDLNLDMLPIFTKYVDF